MKAPLRIKLFIDIFTLSKQIAQVIDTLAPSALIAAILQEFGEELEFLSDMPADYQLIKVEGGTLLSEEKTLMEQVNNGDHLRLIEKETMMPLGAFRFSQPIYLRDVNAKKVYRLSWHPAIIGRDDHASEMKDKVEVDLTNHQAGLRVSRRHVMVSESEGAYYVEAMTDNPTIIRSRNRDIHLTNMKHPIQSGDSIVLERSGILLKFIVGPIPSINDNL